MKKLFSIFLLSAIACFFSLNSNAQSIKEHKVVIQLNTADTASWSSTIGNIKNLQKVWPNNISIEVVVHGKGLDLLVANKTHLANDVNGLTKEGVVFSACENSMRKHNITKADLLPVAVTVPSGARMELFKSYSELVLIFYFEKSAIIFPSFFID
jgi:intracellular sulfur oxidation DsrE/DsrF family protein